MDQVNSFMRLASAVVPAVNLLVLLFSAFRAFSMLSSTLSVAMELIKQMQEQHQKNSVHIAGLESTMSALWKEIERISGIVNHKNQR